MNPWVIILLLTLVVPTQLLINLALRSTNVEYGGWKQAIVTNFIESVHSVYDNVQDTAKYYSNMRHVKELFMVPHVPAKQHSKTYTYTDPHTGQHMLGIIGSEEDEDIVEERQKSPGKSSNVRLKHKKVNSKASESAKRPPPHPRKEDVSTAHEVEEYNNNHFYFARSEKPRTSRRNILYKIGHIVQHKTNGYHGIVIGWDYECRAPDNWKKQYGYNSGKRKHLVNSPHYLIMESGSEAQDPELHYIPQDHLRLSQDTQLNIEPSVFNEYFDLMENIVNSEGIRQIKYRPKAWLMKRYPEDD